MESDLKEKAISLRKQGLSYSEILKHVPVAKSTLSLWLRSVGLSKKQEQRLTEKKLAAALRGAAKKREIRIEKTNTILEKAAKDIDEISKKELFLMGVALYWAEGSKEKSHYPGSGVQFSNSDANMVRLFLKWLSEICSVPKEKISFDIYIHESNKNRTDKVIDYWSKSTGFDRKYFQHIYFKRNKIRTKRKNIGESYYGLVRVRVKTSSDLNRKIAGWINGVVKCLR